MAQDKRQTTKIPKWANKEAGGGLRLDASTYIGFVKNNVDPARSGRLQIWIPDFGGDEKNPANWRTVSYASPYFGATYQPDSSKNNSYTGVNHTYGLWMTPPDIDNQVLCTFVNGDPDRGYWFACINPTLSHYMVPGMAAGNKTDKKLVSDDIKKSILPDSNVPPQKLPVAEFNENQTTNKWDDFLNIPKPVHEFQANILFKQGLDRDGVRGAITSSSQRETPSRVFGISTPGRPNGNDPADDPAAYQQKLASGTLTENDYAVKSRKGGHTFVMDDGDIVGKDNLIRLRTAGGHQILMNDTERVLYIANGDGSVWVELAGSGQLHIYSSGGYNLHSEGDINMHSGGNFNVHAEKNVNLNATGELNAVGSTINISAVNKLNAWGGKTILGSGGSMVIGAASIKVGADGLVTIDGSKLQLNSGDASNSTEGGAIELFKHSDTGFDEKTNLWNEIPGAAESIVSILPQHEPWSRKAAAGIKKDLIGNAPTKAVTTSDCAPKTGGKPADYKLPPPNGNNLDKGKVKGQPVPWSTDTAFLDKVKSVAGQFNANYMDLLAIIHQESAASFDPAITNSIGATGLIQFMPSTARGLGTSTSELAQLSRVDQMDWVAKFFASNRLSSKAPTPTIGDLYCCVFWPAAVGKPDNYVIAPAGSTVANQNRSLQGSDGSITNASVAAAAASKLAIVQQCLANAGATTTSAPTGANTGTTVSDGSGNAVTTSSASTNNTDIGIKNAAGKSIEGETCPGEWLRKSDAYNPPGGIGDKAPKFTQVQVKAMMAELGYLESKWDYSKDTTTKIGKYQTDGSYLTDVGYIKYDAFTQYPVNTVLSNPESWTNKDGMNSKQSFMENKAIQDKTQYDEFVSYYNALRANGGIKDTDDICTAAGMLFVAHQFANPSKAKEWRDKGLLKDSLNRGGDVYFNHGRYAIDVLAAGGAATTNMVGDGKAAAAKLKPQLTTVKSSSGARAQVAVEYAEAFQGFIDDLENSGYRIKDLCGYADRDVRGISGVKSAHAYGAAIDINPAANPLGSSLVTDMPVDVVKQLCSKWGLGWGGLWNSRKDAMHFSMLKREGGSASVAPDNTA